MEQALVSQQQGYTEEVIEVESSLDPEESSMIASLLQRVRHYGQAGRQVQEQIVEAPEESGDDLQEMLNEVADQVPDDDEPPDDDPSSSTSGGEKCGVCERSFRNRGPTVTCAGCTKKVHKNYCVKYMRMSTNLRAGMCNMCCGKVEDWYTEVREYVNTQGLTWNQEDWLRKLVKSHSRGIGLSYQTFRPFNRLQRFLWTALGRGLIVRENYAPFAPMFFSSTTTGVSSVGRTPRGPSDARQGVQPRPTPPWQTPPGGSSNSPTRRERSAQR